MKVFMLIISFIALLDAIVTMYMVNTLCSDQQLPLNLFFGVITAFIIWIIAFQIQEMRSKV
jgi:hypothetical protein